MLWGLIIEPERSYTQKVEHRLHISKAVVDIFCPPLFHYGMPPTSYPTSYPTSSPTSSPTQLTVRFKGETYVLCTFHEVTNSTLNGIVQCDLDLNFDIGDEIVFATTGSNPSTIHVTGYTNTDEEDLKSSNSIQQTRRGGHEENSTRFESIEQTLRDWQEENSTRFESIQQTIRDWHEENLTRCQSIQKTLTDGHAENLTKFKHLQEALKNLKRDL